MTTHKHMNVLTRLFHLLGFHDWKPTPQGPGDFIWGYRMWICACGKKEARREHNPDPVDEVMERVWAEK